ncbi:MAG TPA: thioredoxin family protein [Thermoanaerobaculia bacterium]|nr:thioredoxin family protein [Thermoanaerobaculia bacterium]
MPLFLLTALLSTVLSAPTREWRDSIRDVYINGKLTRAAQTLTTSEPRMLAVVCGDEVLILDPAAQSVAKAAASELTFVADRTKATSSALNTERAGTLVQSDGTYLALINGRSVLVAPHQSHAGPMTLEELWETAPVWRKIAETYEPDGALVARLRAIDKPLRLTVVMATWCGDSRQHVPRLLKSIERAHNPNLSVELIGIDAEFLQPSEVIAGQNITNVPTVIVRDGAKELGRFVETPASATIEDDVCDIAAGTQKPHPGRYDRGALLKSGTYVLRDAHRRVEGNERFELYERPGGGVLAHSVIAKRDGMTETWAALDEKHETRFVEVTHRAGTTTRTRYRRDGESWSAHSRGSSGGIVDQSVPASATVIAPATITYAWARNATSAYVVPEDGVGMRREVKFRVDAADVPRWVKLEDGSTRKLVTPR